jgi:hypothetical protein
MSADIGTPTSSVELDVILHPITAGFLADVYCRVCLDEGFEEFDTRKCTGYPTCAKWCGANFVRYCVYNSIYTLETLNQTVNI